MTVNQTQQLIASNDCETFVREYLLPSNPLHVSNEDVAFILARMSESFSVSSESIQLWVVGSANLGFSLTDKTVKKIYYPRYRRFSLESDIDLAVVCQPIFEQIWDDLSRHSHRSFRFPWESYKCGDYLVCGWLRPDHFPNGPLVTKCNTWRDLFYSLSTNARFKRRKVRGGLFYSVEELVRYQCRCVTACKKALGD
jgi:hypothetical protein